MQMRLNPGFQIIRELKGLHMYSNPLPPQ